MGEKTLVGLIGTAILFCTGVYFGSMNADRIKTAFSYMKQQVELRQKTPAQRIGDALIYGARHYPFKYSRTQLYGHRFAQPVYQTPVNTLYITREK
jgi:hypothetical protein